MVSISTILQSSFYAKKLTCCRCTRGIRKVYRRMQLDKETCQSGNDALLQKQFYSDRAWAYLNDGRFREFLRDTNIYLGLDPTHSKAQLREEHALYSMECYVEALEALDKFLACKAAPNNDNVSLRVRILARLKEQTSGEIDLKHWASKISYQNPNNDVASYKKPTMTQRSSGGGRGRFVAQAIKAG